MPRSRRVGSVHSRASRRFLSTVAGEADEIKQVAYEIALNA